MQRIGYIKGPSASEVEAFDKLFDGNLTVSEAEVMDVLFPAIGKGSSRQLRRCKATPRSHRCVGFGRFLYVISKQEIFCKDGSAMAVLGRPPSALDRSELYVCLSSST